MFKGNCPPGSNSALGNGKMDARRKLVKFWVKCAAYHNQNLPLTRTYSGYICYSMQACIHDVHTLH